MEQTVWLLALAYIAGLLVAPIPWSTFILAGLGIALTLVQLRRGGVSPWMGLIAAGLAIAAGIYLNWRSPHPSSQDISQWLAQHQNRPTQTLVTGTVTSVPRLTRSQKAQLWLQVSHVTPLAGETLDAGKPVTGQLYVTVPLLQATGVSPGQLVNLQGLLYPPSSGGGRCLFDFQAYLAQNDSFAGLSAQTLDVSPVRQPAWGGWQLQQKIVRSLTQGLDVPAGPLMSAMVIGNQAVDIPFDVRDWFVRSGLCHALAASGFQVSLILGVILVLTERFSPRIQAGIGVVALLFFLALSGFQASVVRAVLMGFAVLLGVVSDRKIKPLNALVLVAVLMLVVNPNWIGDLGFQFSFLATLGLLVTAPVLTQRMDWLPPVLATAIAVPIAATLWTLPVQIYSFCLVSPYSLLANIITAPLITLVSLWGFASALLSLVWEPLGSFAAWLLSYPTLLLIQIVQGFSVLPGNLVATGTISILQLVGVYSLWLAIWKIPLWQKRWVWVGSLAIALMVVPTVSAQSAKVQLTVLDHPNPVLVAQHQGKVGLFVTGALQNPEFTVLPFLRQQGINRLDTQQGLQPADQQILQKSIQIPDSRRKPSVSPTADSGESNPSTSRTIPAIQWQAGKTHLDLELDKTHWLADWGKDVPVLQSRAEQTVLVWSGRALDARWIQQHPLKAAIATGKLNSNTAEHFRQNKIPLYSIQETGAIAWTPSQGITPIRELQTNVSWIP